MPQRMNRRRIRLVLIAAFALLVAGTPTDADAKRKKKKTLIKATVAGKTIKMKYNSSITGNETVAFFVIAQTRPRRGFFRTMSVACGVFPPPAVPGPGDFCAVNYQETRTTPVYSGKFWLNLPGQSQVTFDSYDGETVSGTFSGDLDSVTGDPPIHVEGTFRGRILPATQ
jgi:hypothetical protein